MAKNLGQVFFIHEAATPPPKTNMIWLRPLNETLGTYDILRWNGTAWVIFEPTIGGVWRGVWSGATTYKRYDIVRYNDALFSALQDNLNKIPSTNLSDWDLVYGAVGGDVTQGTIGTQNAGQIAFWEATNKTLSRGTLDLYWNAGLYSVGYNIFKGLYTLAGTALEVRNGDELKIFRVNNNGDVYFFPNADDDNFFAFTGIGTSSFLSAKVNGQPIQQILRVYPTDFGFSKWRNNVSVGVISIYETALQYQVAITSFALASTNGGIGNSSFLSFLAEYEEELSPYLGFDYSNKNRRFKIKSNLYAPEDPSYVRAGLQLSAQFIEFGVNEQSFVATDFMALKLGVNGTNTAATVGFYGATPVEKQTVTVAAPTNLSEAITQINELKSILSNYGLL